MLRSEELQDGRVILPVDGQHVHLRVLHSTQDVWKRVNEVAHDVQQSNKHRDPYVLTVAQAGRYLATHVRDAMVIKHRKFTSDVIDVKSRRGTEAVGCSIIRTPIHPVLGRNVVIVESIVDSGATLTTVGDWLRSQGAASVCAVVLVNKTCRLTVGRVPITNVCFSHTPDLPFVVGCGMDYKGRLRTLSYIAEVTDIMDMAGETKGLD